MEIHKSGETGITLKFSTGTVAVNPPAKKKLPLSAVILNTYSVPVAGWSGVFTAEDGQKVFTGAGEYEKDALILQGVSSGTVTVDNDLQTTSWLVVGDDIRIAVLGDVDGREDTNQIAAQFIAADVLVCFCNTTGEKRLAAVDIAGAVSALGVRRIVLIGDNRKLQKDIGGEIGNAEEVVGKCTIKKKDIADETVSVITVV